MSSVSFLDTESTRNRGEVDSSELREAGTDMGGFLVAGSGEVCRRGKGKGISIDPLCRVLYSRGIVFKRNEKQMSGIKRPKLGRPQLLVPPRSTSHPGNPIKINLIQLCLYTLILKNFNSPQRSQPSTTLFFSRKLGGQSIDHVSRPDRCPPSARPRKNPVIDESRGIEVGPITLRGRITGEKASPRRSKSKRR